MKKKSAAKKTASRSKKNPKQFVLVRTVYAGVHCGYLEKKEKMEVILSMPRRIHRWKGANTLYEMANNGVDEVYSRISEPAQNGVTLEAIEIIPCSPTAKTNLEKSRWGA